MCMKSMNIISPPPYPRPLRILMCHSSLVTRGGGGGGAAAGAGDRSLMNAVPQLPMPPTEGSQPRWPLASASSDLLRWSRFLSNHTLDATRSC